MIEGEGEAIFWGLGVEQGFLGDGASGFDVSGIVEGGEGVERGIGAGGFDRADRASRGIEEHRGADDSSPESVKTSAVEIWAFSLEIFFMAEAGFFPDPPGLVGANGVPADLIDEESADGESLIAEDGGGESEAGTTSEEAVLGIAFGEGWGGGGGLLVGGAGEDGAEEFFGIPARVTEIGG